MEMHLDEDGFVRAPAGVCYRVLTDAGAWDRLWPRTRVTVTGRDTVAVRARPRSVGSQLRLAVELHGWRHDEGFRLRVDGDVRGVGEVWLEPVAGGTVVHHLWQLEGGRRRQLLRFRRWVRLGLWGLKDHVHAGVTAVGGTT